jgi:PRC-barrel domain protein
MSSIRDRNDTSRRLMAADQVEDTRVYNPAGKNRGGVGDVMIDKISSRIANAVVDFDGFLDADGFGWIVSRRRASVMLCER